MAVLRGRHGAAGSTDEPCRPEALAGILDPIVGQLDMLTRTVGVLEQRLMPARDRLQRGREASLAESATAVRGRDWLLFCARADVWKTYARRRASARRVSRRYGRSYFVFSWVCLPLKHRL